MTGTAESKAETITVEHDWLLFLIPLAGGVGMLLYARHLTKHRKDRRHGP